MVLKRIAKGLAGLVLAASLMVGCENKTNTQYVDVHHWQTPVSRQIIYSDDGKYAATAVQEGTDYEVYLFDSEKNSLSNITNDPVNSDQPFAFVGNHLVVESKINSDASKIRIYDASTGNLVRESKVFEELDYRFVVYGNRTKIIFEAEDYDSSSNDRILRYDSSNSTLEDLITGVDNANMENVSPDQSLAYIRYHDPVLGTVLALFKAEDGSVTPILNFGSHNVWGISENNEIGLIQNWNGGSDEIKVHDIKNGLVNIAVNPAGKSFRWIDGFSADGSRAIVMFSDNTTNDWEYYSLDTQNRTYTFIKSMPSTTNEFYAPQMSPTGLVSLLRENFETIQFYNSSTPEIYDPLADITRNSTDFIGFTKDDYAIIRAMTWNPWQSTFYLHNPGTKANTPIEEAGYSFSWINMLPGRQHVLIEAHDDVAGWDAFIIKDPVTGTVEKIIKQEGKHLDYSGSSPDGNLVYLQTEDKDTSNLIVYDRSTDVLAQVTNYIADPDTEPIERFKIMGHSKDQKVVFFTEYNWNDTETIKQYDFSTGLIKTVGYGD